MTVFADSSALVKLYADEPGHEQVREQPLLVIAELARVEVPSALWRKQRGGELRADDARLLVADFEADYFGAGSEPPRFIVTSATAVVLDEAARACAVHGLRAYDAVQLAAALVTRAAVPGCETLAAFDVRLRAAAAAEGFELLPRDEET